MNSEFTPQTHRSLSNRASRRAGRAGRNASRALVATSACIATSSLVAAHADGVQVGVRLADANAYKRAETGPQVQLLQPGYSATLKGTDVPIVVKISGRKFAPKSLELFVDGLNASNGALALDSSPTVELKWDTTLFPDGVHRLTVRVTDVQGFIGQSETQVFINNKGTVDTSAPVLSWLNINDGDRLKGEVSIQLKASDNFGVKYIFVSINPAITPTRKPPLRQYLVNRPPYAFSFDTTKVPDGIYVLDALAWDALENEGKAPTRTFGVLNNALNSTIMNDMPNFASKGRVAALPPDAATPDTSEQPSGNAVASGATTALATTPSPMSGGSRPGGRALPSNNHLPVMPAQGLEQTAPSGPRVAEIPGNTVQPETGYTPPGDDSLTIAATDRRGAASPGSRVNVVPTVRQTPRLVASAPDATGRVTRIAPLPPMRVAEMPHVAVPRIAEAPAIAPHVAPRVLEAGTPSIAASEFSMTSSGVREANRAHHVATLRATAPAATAPRMALAEETLPRFPQQDATPPQVSAVSQTLELALATRPSGIASAEHEYAPRFSAPAAAPRHAASVETPVVKSAANAGAPSVTVGSTHFSTAPSTRPVALPARGVKVGTLRDTLPSSIQRLVRAAIDAPRPVPVATVEAALSLSVTPQSTLTSHLRTPRYDASNPLRSDLDLTSFKRITPGAPVGAPAELAPTETGPAAVFISAPVSSRHDAALPKVVHPVAQRATLPVFPKINESHLAPSMPAVGRTEARLSMLPKPAAQKRDMRNAITIAPSRTAKALPVSYTAPHDTFLSAVAKQYDVAPDMLAAVNNLKVNAKLARGQEILFPREISVRYAGKPVTGDVASLMVGSTSVTAFRFMFEKNGGTMKWDAAKQRVIAKDGTHEIVLTVGSKTATVNRKEEMMEMAAFLLSGRTMVPVRFFEKTMAAHVEWEPATGRMLVSVANPTTIG